MKELTEILSNEINNITIIADFKTIKHRAGYNTVEWLSNGVNFDRKPVKAGTEGRIYETNERGVVTRILDALDGSLITVEGEFYLFDGVIYKKAKEAELLPYIDDAILAMRDAIIFTSEDDKDKAEEIKKAIKKKKNKLYDSLTTSRGSNNIIAQLKRATERDHDELNSHAYAIAFKNGIFDYEKNTFIPKGDNRCKAYEFTQSSPANWRDNAPSPQNWLNTLDCCTAYNEDVKNDILMHFGHLFIGENKTQRIGLLKGNTRNGKTVVLNGVMNALGDYCQPFQNDLFIQRDSGGHQAHIFALKGFRASVGSEIESGKRMGWDTLKNITGNEPVQASPKHGQPESFIPVVTFAVATNALPYMAGVDNASKERFVIFPCAGQTIAESERDTTLGDKIKKETDGIIQVLHPYILEAVHSTTVEFSETTKKYTAEQITESDPFEMWFLNEVKPLLLQEHAYILLKETTAKFRKAYNTWCANNGCLPLSISTFSTRFKEALPRHGWEESRRSLNHMDNINISINFNNDADCINQVKKIKADTVDRQRCFYNVTLAKEYAKKELESLKGRNSDFKAVDVDLLNKINERQ